jgi:hypothetical protein
LLANSFLILFFIIIPFLFSLYQVFLSRPSGSGAGQQLSFPSSALWSYLWFNDHIVVFIPSTSLFTGAKVVPFGGADKQSDGKAPVGGGFIDLGQWG